jgi:sulfur transfer complex TusBCD TusB component (DsrH family)
MVSLSKFDKEKFQEKKNTPTKRKAIQLVESEQGIVALCDDGTMWRLEHNQYSSKDEWVKLVDIE